MLKAAFLYQFLLLLFLCNGSTISFAQEQEMRSIEEFISTEGRFSDKASNAQIQFVGLRCSAIYLILSEWTKDNKILPEAEKFRKAAENAFEMAYQAKGSSSDDFITKQIDFMVKGYVERMQKAKAMTGNSLSDSVVASDLKTCGSIF